jgi:putative transposase
MPNDDRLRVELIERLCRVPAETLPEIRRFLAQLDSPATGGTVIPPIAEPIRPLRDWPHAPLHRLSEHGTYFVTAGTLHKQHLFAGPEGLDLLESKLLTLANDHGVQLEAWAVFSNHYHFVGHTTSPNHQLHELLSHLHTATASELNLRDRTPEREVWHNFRDARLTFEKSYFARLNYVHQNPVKHRLAPVASQYRWCSAAWFERTATNSQVNTIYSFKTDRVHIPDDFEPV